MAPSDATKEALASAIAVAAASQTLLLLEEATKAVFREKARRALGAARPPAPGSIERSEPGQGCVQGVE